MVKDCDAVGVEVYVVVLVFPVLESVVNIWVVVLSLVVWWSALRLIVLKVGL